MLKKGCTSVSSYASILLESVKIQTPSISIHAQCPAIADAEDSDNEKEEEEAATPMVAEQRVSNLIQSLMQAISLALMHVIQLIPTAVIWWVCSFYCEPAHASVIW
jgi:hypothetical protein